METTATAQHQESDKDSGIVTPTLVVLIIILIVAVFWPNRVRRHQGGAACHNAGAFFDELGAIDELGALDELDELGALYEPHGCAPRANHSAHNVAFGRLYSTADVDPLITGQLYGHADHVRNIYAQRTAHGKARGLVEYSSAGGFGDVGVDEGPIGLAEYGGRQAGFDDGIPGAWKLPDTPIRWYRPAQRDYYGPEGPTVYSKGLFNLTEPDHDVLTN